MKLFIALCLVSLLCVQLADAHRHGSRGHRRGPREESYDASSDYSEDDSDYGSDETSYDADDYDSADADYSDESSDYSEDDATYGSDETSYDESEEEESHELRHNRRNKFGGFGLRRCRRELRGGNKCQNDGNDREWWTMNSQWACQKWGIWKYVIHHFLKSTGTYANYCLTNACETGVGHICKLEAVNQDTGTVFLSHRICEGGCGALESCKESDLDCTGVTLATPLKFALCRMGNMFRGCYKMKVYRCQCDAPMTEPPTTVEPETEPPTTVAPTAAPTTAAPTAAPTTAAPTNAPSVTITAAPTAAPTTTAPSLNKTTTAPSVNVTDSFLAGLDGVGFPNF